MNWPSRDKPAYPFEYIRYDEFVGAVRALASSGHCTYAPFDWDTLAISDKRRTVTSTRTVIIEGVSALNPELCEFYGLRIFVDSDRSTTLDAAERRGTGRWSQPWRDLFLPSVDIYMESHPQGRADLIVAGRG
jgi:uridine kinase